MSPTVRERILASLAAEGPARVGALALRVKAKRESVSRAVTILAAEGLVTRGVRRDDAVTLNVTGDVTGDVTTVTSEVTSKETSTKYENDDETSLKSLPLKDGENKLVSSSSYHSSGLDVTVTVTGDRAGDHVTITSAIAEVLARHALTEGRCAHANAASVPPALSQSATSRPPTSSGSDERTASGVSAGTGGPITSLESPGSAPGGRLEERACVSTTSEPPTTSGPPRSEAKRASAAIWLPDAPDRKRVLELATALLRAYPREDGKTGEDDVQRYPVTRVRRAVQHVVARAVLGKPFTGTPAAMFWSALTTEGYTFEDDTLLSGSAFAERLAARGLLAAVERLAWARWHFSREGLDAIGCTAEVPEADEPDEQPRRAPDERSAGPVRLGGLAATLIKRRVT